MRVPRAWGRGSCVGPTNSLLREIRERERGRLGPALWGIIHLCGWFPGSYNFLKGGPAYRDSIRGGFALYEDLYLGQNYDFGRDIIAIRICKENKTSCCSRRLLLLLSMRKRVPTHFYEERKTQQKDSRFIRRTSFRFFILDLCSTRKDLIFLCERLFRSIQQDLLRYCDTSNPILMIIYH